MGNEPRANREKSLLLGAAEDRAGHSIEQRANREGREVHDLTQQQLAEATGIAQADISRLENGTGNPSLRTLKRLAAGMGMTLKLEFVPIPPAGQ